MRKRGKLLGAKMGRAVGFLALFLCVGLALGGTTEADIPGCGIDGNASSTDGSITINWATTEFSCAEQSFSITINGTTGARWTWRATQIWAESGGNYTPLGDCLNNPTDCTDNMNCQYSFSDINFEGLPAGAYNIVLRGNTLRQPDSPNDCNDGGDICGQPFEVGPLVAAGEGNFTELSADAGEDVSTCQGVGVTIGGDPAASGGAAPYSYSWLPTAGLDDPTASNPVAMPGSSQTYMLVVADANNCTADSEVLVDTKDCAPVPTMTEWGMILAVLLLGALSVLAIRRKRRSA